MSRSYRHSEVIKYAGDTGLKKIFNRKLRRKYKNDLDFPSYNAYRKMNESWDIADVRCLVSFEDYKDWYKDSGMTEEEMYAEWKREYKSK